MDFLNKNQKVYIGEEEKKIFLEKLKRDVEVMIGCPEVPCIIKEVSILFLKFFCFLPSICGTKIFLPLFLGFAEWKVGGETGETPIGGVR